MRESSFVRWRERPTHWLICTQATIHGETFQRLDHGLFHAQHIPKDSHTKKIYFTNRGYASQSMAWRAAEFVYVHLRTCHRIGASERAVRCRNRPVS